MFLKNAFSVSACTLLMAGVTSFTASAADIAPPPESSDWRFTFAPYVWGVGLSGDVGVFGRGPVEVDIPFSDIFENLDFAAMAVAEAHNGTWGVFFDANYTSLEASKSISRTVVEQPGVEVGLSASADITEFFGTLMGQWRAVDVDEVTLDLMAGARYWHIENDISVRFKLNGSEVLSLSGSDGASWVDPMVGAKARIDTGTPVFFLGWGMVGGFGVGSDLNWDVMGSVGYQWTDNFSTVLGYRALGVDYDEDGFVYDVVQQGVALGGLISF